VAWASRSKTFNVYSWWGVLLVSVVGALLVGLCVALFWPSTYTATSSFFVSDPAELLSTMLSGSTGLPGETSQSNLKPTQERLAAILASHLLRAKLVKKHELDRRFGLDPVMAAEILARMAKITPIGTEGFSIAVTCKGYSALRVAVSLTLNHEEARSLCAALANDYLGELQQYVTETSVAEARKRREFIQSAQHHVVGNLDQAQGGIERLQRQHALLDPEAKATLTADRIKALEQGYAEAGAKVDETQSSLSKAQGQLGRVDSMRIASVVEMRNPIIGSLEQKLADLRVELATQTAQGKTPQHRDVAQLLTAIASTESQLAQIKQEVHKEIAQSANPTYEKIAGEVVDLRVALAGARARRSRTGAQLAGARAEMADLPPVARKYAALKQDRDIQFQALAALKQSLAVALVQEQQSQRVGEFLVLDHAVPPPDLYRPPVLFSMILTAAALLAVFGLLALNRMIFGR
jgi:uncharacterized protein involved in exopolysaccharide biosynthesis